MTVAGYSTKESRCRRYLSKPQLWIVWSDIFVNKICSRFCETYFIYFEYEVGRSCMSLDKTINVIEQLGNGVKKEIVTDKNGKVMFVALTLGGNDETTNESTTHEDD